MHSPERQKLQEVLTVDAVEVCDVGNRLCEGDAIFSGRRQTQAWDDETEDLLEKWRVEACAHANLHDKAARLKQRMRTRVALPSLIIPGIMAPFTQIFESVEWFKYVNCAAFAVTGALSIITTFFKFGEKMTEHDRASLENAKLAQEIRTILTYKRHSRDDPKVVVAKLQGLRTNIMTNSPPIAE